MTETSALEPSDWPVTVEASISPAGHAAVLSGLIGYNEQAAGPGRHAPIAVYVRGPDATIVGGLEGRTSYCWLIIELVFLPEACRGQRVGARVLRQAEEEAVRRGCHGARLDTASFQARGFYEKQGYAVFGELDLGSGGHRLFFMHKDLRAAAA
ncbi:GNAT family N-acetyltransferase [uncultured Enterovirga sp.]|uniref:GNAT family N-acetyltransferase n=1 Tax=uncultured Enterovirga sp. TaxID=2026352 RepID=UPI0035CAE8AB